MGRTRRAIQGIVTSYISYVILIVVQIYLSPLILKKYGQETLGAYAAVMQLIGYLTLLEGALSVTFNRYISQAFGSNEKNSALVLIYDTSKLVYFSVGLFNGILIIGTSFFTSQLFNVQGSLAQDLNTSITILGLACIVKTPFQIFSTFLNAAQYMAYNNIIASLSALTRGIAIIVLVNLDFGITGIIIGNVIADFMTSVAGLIYFNNKFTDLKHVFRFPSIVFLKEILKFSKSSLLIQIVTKIRFQTDTLLVSIFLSVSAASVFYSSITPPLICFTLANMLMSNTLPGMNEIVGSNDLKKIKSIYTQLNTYFIILAVIAFIGIVLLNEFVVILWVGEGQYVGWEVNILFALHSSLLIIASFNGNFLIAIGKVNRLAKLNLIISILGLILSISLIKYFGMAGLMIGSILASLPGITYCFKLIRDQLGPDAFRFHFSISK